MKKTIFGLVFAVAMPVMFAAQPKPAATGSQAQPPSKDSTDTTTKKKSKKGSKKAPKKGSDTTASK